MKFSLVITVLALALITETLFSSPRRVVRSVGEREVRQEREIVFPRILDAQDTLSYEDPEDIPNFITIPNSFGDKYYNVRFTPLYAPYQLFAVHLPLFDMFGEAGEPGMEVSIWESGNQDGLPGYPTERITAVTIDFEDLIFSGEDPVFNVVDLSRLNISFNDEVDFHIAINLIPSESADSNGIYDTLGIYIDNGQYFDEDSSSRSGLFDGEEGVEFPWVRLQDLEGFDPYNFAIHAVIGPPVSVPGNPITVISPQTIMVNPAFPNPFNEYTTVRISVPYGVNYSAQLIDQSGRLIHNISEGVGSGTSLINIKASNYPAGNYFLKLTSANESKLVQLVYLK